MTTSTPLVMRGACLCGAVRFQIDAPTKWCAHCHCTMCRRAHGAAFVTWVGVQASQLRVVDGQADLVAYASSAPAKRTFCGACGSTLFFESTRWPDEIHVALANVDDPIDRAPTAHVFFDLKVPWVEVHDALGKRGGEDGMQPLPLADAEPA